MIKLIAVWTSKFTAFFFLRLGYPHFFLCLASSDRPRFSRFQKKKKVMQKATTHYFKQMSL